MPYLEMMSQPGEMTSMLMELRKRELKQGQLALLVLGDSVALGQGSQKETEGYAGSIARYFEKQHIHVQYKNRGIAGLTSANLLQLLKENRGWQADIRQADLVLISVGGNDILQPIFSREQFQETFQLLKESYQAYEDMLRMGHVDQAANYYAQVINRLENTLAIADASDNFHKQVLND
ncbi:SGNH/GDSL hydrolase family protein [Laceyella putida]|uniref:SGNH/GDSL hydrolase family protein n=1 Tax=Laceyella putida TaxID=110101 RepID=A0ABW2RI05_9BACL